MTTITFSINKKKQQARDIVKDFRQLFLDHSESVPLPFEDLTNVFPANRDHFDFAPDMVDISQLVEPVSSRDRRNYIDNVLTTTKDTARLYTSQCFYAAKLLLSKCDEGLLAALEQEPTFNAAKTDVFFLDAFDSRIVIGERQ